MPPLSQELGPRPDSLRDHRAEDIQEEALPVLPHLLAQLARDLENLLTLGNILLTVVPHTAQTMVASMGLVDDKEAPVTLTPRALLPRHPRHMEQVPQEALDTESREEEESQLSKVPLSEQALLIPVPTKARPTRAPDGAAPPLTMAGLVGAVRSLSVQRKRGCRRAPDHTEVEPRTPPQTLEV